MDEQSERGWKFRQRTSSYVVSSELNFLYGGDLINGIDRERKQPCTGSRMLARGTLSRNVQSFPSYLGLDFSYAVVEYCS